MSLAERLRSGEKLYTAWSGIPDVTTTEVLAASAFDVITLDMQHGGHHEDSVLKATGAILAAGKPAVVRIPVGRFDMASRALDFGADAVIAPMVNSIEDAQRFAERRAGDTEAFDEVRLPAERVTLGQVAVDDQLTDLVGDLFGFLARPGSV